MTSGGFHRLPHPSQKNYWHCNQTLPFFVFKNQSGILGFPREAPAGICVFLAVLTVSAARSRSEYCDRNRDCGDHDLRKIPERRTYEKNRTRNLLLFTLHGGSVCPGRSSVRDLSGLLIYAR